MDDQLHTTLPIVSVLFVKLKYTTHRQRCGAKTTLTKYLTQRRGEKEAE